MKLYAAFGSKDEAESMSATVNAALGLPGPSAESHGLVLIDNRAQNPTWLYLFVDEVAGGMVTGTKLTRDQCIDLGYIYTGDIE